MNELGIRLELNKCLYNSTNHSDGILHTTGSLTIEASYGYKCSGCSWCADNNVALPEGNVIQMIERCPFCGVDGEPYNDGLLPGYWHYKYPCGSYVNVCIVEHRTAVTSWLRSNACSSLFTNDEGDVI